MVEQSELQGTQIAKEFEGSRFGGTQDTFLLVEAPPGTGPRLHSHPYDEVFITLEGQATFTAG